MLVYLIVFFVRSDTDSVLKLVLSLSGQWFSGPRRWMMFLVSLSMPQMIQTSGPRLCNTPKRIADN